MKYADDQSVVLIWDEYFPNEMRIVCENACINGNKNRESYHIGIKNIKAMMKEMEGGGDIIQTDESFQICLRFRFKSGE